MSFPIRIPRASTFTRDDTASPLFFEPRASNPFAVSETRPTRGSGNEVRRSIGQTETREYTRDQRVREGPRAEELSASPLPRPRGRARLTSSRRRFRESSVRDVEEGASQEDDRLALSQDDELSAEAAAFATRCTALHRIGARADRVAAAFSSSWSTTRDCAVITAACGRKHVGTRGRGGSSALYVSAGTNACARGRANARARVCVCVSHSVCATSRGNPYPCAEREKERRDDEERHKSNGPSAVDCGGSPSSPRPDKSLLPCFSSYAAPGTPFYEAT